MKTYTTKNIRNIVLIGAPRSGKTTLSEAMLFEGKVIDRRGSVEDKNTVSDNTEFEQTNQKSINATPLYAEFNGCKINFIDAPGSDDFSGGALSAFKVVEAAVMVMSVSPTSTFKICWFNLHIFSPISLTLSPRNTA